MFPTDWPGMKDSADVTTVVRVRVEVKGKGVAHHGAALYADDLPADGRADSAESETEPMSEEEPEPEATAETAAIEESTAVGTAEPRAEARVEDQAEPNAAESAIGYVTSELPRGAGRLAAATALCSAAALQHVRHDQ